MSHTEILIALLIASKSGRRNRAFKGWVPIVLWTQKSDKKGQILCHSKADVSQEDVLAGAGSHGVGMVLDPSGVWVRSWDSDTSSAILTISESCFSTDLINCPLINSRVIGHFSFHGENVLTFSQTETDTSGEDLESSFWKNESRGMSGMTNIFIFSLYVSGA